MRAKATKADSSRAPKDGALEAADDRPVAETRNEAVGAAQDGAGNVPQAGTEGVMQAIPSFPDLEPALPRKEGARGANKKRRR
jgi:hypothetical protein